MSGRSGAGWTWMRGVAVAAAVVAGSGAVALAGPTTPLEPRPWVLDGVAQEEPPPAAEPAPPAAEPAAPPAAEPAAPAAEPAPPAAEPTAAPVDPAAPAADPAAPAADPAAPPGKGPDDNLFTPPEEGARPDKIGTEAESKLRYCGDCHATKGVSGHRPPKAALCDTCHVEKGTNEAGDHLVFAPADRGTCLGCHQELKPEDRKRPHTPATSGPCTICHDPHDTSKKKSHLVSKFGDEVCYGACHEGQDVQPHERLDTTKFTHTAIKRGQCAGCHDPHGSNIDQDGMLKYETVMESCAGCHKDQVAKKKISHLPATTGACYACHTPHGSQFAGNVKLVGQNLCYQCHTPKDTLPQVHSAVQLGRCAKCHDPHGSEYPRKLRGDPVNQVCFRCHDDDITGRKIVHAPVGAGYCIICHDPHQTRYPKNLRMPVNMTCTQCHPEKDRPNVKTVHMAVKAYGCTVCHDPHASENEFRLRKPIVKLCTSCHVGYDDGYHVVQRPAGGGHPIGNRNDPLREGRELVCTSCHDPHGTNNPRMWYRAGTRLALCVECHRGTLAPGTAAGTSTFEQDAQKKKEREEKSK